MTTPDELGHHNHRTTYIVAGAIIAVLMVIGLIVFRSGQDSTAAAAKADALIAAIEAKGYKAPSRETIVQVLGTDGGSVCADPTAGLRRAIYNQMMVNGSGGPGMRPVIVDGVAVRGQLLIMSIYCPDKLAEFTKYADSLKVANVIKR